MLSNETRRIIEINYAIVKCTCFLIVMFGSVEVKSEIPALHKLLLCNSVL